jgi:hypothetical protein
MYNGSEAIKSLLNKTKTNGLPILDTPIIVHGNELERNRCTPQEGIVFFCVCL